MSKAWKLMKIMVKMQLSMSSKSAMEKAGYFFIALMMIPFGLLILFFIQGIIGNLYATLEPLGNESVILGLLFMMMAFIFSFISIGTVLSSFYFAEDVESFIPLPFQPYQILFGKSAVPFLSLYGLNTVLLLPSLIFYGLHSGAGILYYVFAIIIWAVTPIIPFVLTSIILMFIMRFANISKNKDRTKVLVGLLGFVFVIGINVLVRIDTGGENEDLARLITEQNGLLEFVTKFFPPAYFSSITLTELGTFTGLLYFILIITLSALAIFLFLTIGQKLYFKGVLGLSGGKRNNFKEENVQKQVKQQPVLFSLWKKEIRIILRTPTFFTQIVVQSLFFPIFLIVLIIIDPNSPLTGWGSDLNQMEGKKVILAMFGMTVVALGINPASFSSISRDGKSWFNHLYLPIPPSKVILSKLLVSFFLNFLSLMLITIAALFILEMPLTIWLLWFVLSLVTSWIASIAGLMIDLYSPKLTWTDEREVFKGRFIGIVPLALEATIFGVIILVLWNSGLEGIWSVTAVLLTILVLVSVCAQYFLNRLVDRNYYKLL
ncbi:ABC-2 type transport system permease protein [Halobacillus dabanensis]|uniref:ABC-2 type transport system permease protein n=1 Tax=Halobacillus dabanensis TaxID=240302 RepID=A0A1I3SUF9_HALDA|nr:ABC transporter permease [Halobacillus dabanensis]SFJ62023.1 ABC-2 type transport system permease protein [Halobacillus dabanensis]